MMRLKTNFLLPGMQISQSILTPSGQVFMEQGTFLTIENIKILAQRGISSVHVVLPSNIDYSKLHFLQPYRETVELVATTFETVRYFNEVTIAQFQELEKVYLELMIDIIRVANYLYQLRCYSDYTFRHSLNVAIISGLIGKWLGYTGKTLKDLILTGLLHDTGKSLVPLAIINAPRKITAKEMEVVKEHPYFGYELLKELENISDEVKIGILQHHERFDGSGYPFGLIKDKISLFARIIAIADMYDAMTNERVYRTKLSPFSALETIAIDMHHKLDPDIGILFMTKIQSYLASNSLLFINGGIR